MFLWPWPNFQGHSSRKTENSCWGRICFFWKHCYFSKKIGFDISCKWSPKCHLLIIPRHTIVAGYYGFTLVLCVSVRLSVHQSYVRPSVRPSIFRFRMITWVNVNGFSRNLVCALILWRSGLGLLMGKFRQIFMELSARDTPIFSFLGDNLSK